MITVGWSRKMSNSQTANFCCMPTVMNTPETSLGMEIVQPASVLESQRETTTHRAAMKSGLEYPRSLGQPRHSGHSTTSSTARMMKAFGKNQTRFGTRKLTGNSPRHSKREKPMTRFLMTMLESTAGVASWVVRAPIIPAESRSSMMASTTPIRLTGIQVAMVNSQGSSGLSTVKRSIDTKEMNSAKTIFPFGRLGSG